MKKLFRFLSILCISFIVSCSKTSDNTSNVDSSNLLETSTIAQTYSKVFNKDNRISYNANGEFKDYDSLNISAYRTGSKFSTIFTTILKTPSYTLTEKPSSISNISPYKGIFEIELSFKSASYFNVFTSKDRSYNDVNRIEASKDYSTITINANYDSYFKIEAYTSDVSIKEMIIRYDGKTDITTYDLANYNSYKINISDFYDSYENISEGEERSIPSKITINNDNSYTVDEYKTYIYHTRDYLYNNYSSSNADELALIDPIDVCNYFMLFHTYPLNFFLKDEYNLGGKYFTSSKLRRVSPYSGEYGYSEVVPDNGGTYYELDIDTDGYYSFTNRGMGRVVVWAKGFGSKGYDKNPVCVYTDDHYATFMEYMNYGVFAERFNAETKPTAYEWSNPTILTLFK